MKSVAFAALISACSYVGSTSADAAVDITVPRDMPSNSYPPTGPQLTPGPPPNETYEYIVVGSGAGGSPVAARLALAGHSVLLIDAGADHGHMREVEVPALSIWASERSDLSWAFFTHHYEEEEQAVRDRKMTYRTESGEYYSGTNPPDGAELLGNYYPRVGGLGGCTEHNAMLAILPANNDWDYIKNLTGDSNWDAQKMRNYYKKLENNQYILPNDPTAHGAGGWLSTQLTPIILVAQDLKIISLVVAAASTIGINTDDLVGKVSDLLDGLLGAILPGSPSLLGLVEGLGKLLLNDINNDSPTRDSDTALAQIPLAMHSPDYRRSSPRDWVYDIATATNSDGSKKYKLDIALNTLVSKVTFDNATSSGKPKANGVEYLYGESLYRADPRSDLNADGGVAGSVSATREVIVSGGTFNTPQILKLSGIGPADELARFDIPVVKDLPGVGTNLQDRYELGVSGEAPSNFSILSGCTFLEGDEDPCYDKWVDGVGALKGSYTTGGIALGLFTRSSVAEADHDLWVGGIPGLFQGYFPGYSKTVIGEKNHWTWLVLKAHSRNNAGTVNLTSTNPRDTPKITFNSFYEGAEGAEKDIEAVLEGMRFGIQAFDNLIPLDGEFERIWPPPEVSSDDDLRQWIQDESWGHHASCSAPIGADDDPMAVLDGQFRVRGVDGLRVVDASSTPKIIGTFPVLGFYMMAEKAADDILADAT